MDTLGERIISARKNKGWNQKQLAEALDVNLKNVSRWELDQAKPNIEAATELAKILEVSLDYLGGLSAEGDNDTLTVLFNSKRGSFTKEQESALKTILGAF